MIVSRIPFGKLSVSQGDIGHKNLPFILPPEPAHIVCGWGASYDITSRDFVCHKSPPSQPKSADSLGAQPPIPRERRSDAMGKDIRIAVRMTVKEKDKI